jgi:valyl-tRNA synthetase
VLTEVRKAKSDAKVSMRTEVVRADVRGPAERVALLTGAGTDLASAGRIAELTYADGADELTVNVELQAPTTS